MIIMDVMGRLDDDIATGTEKKIEIECSEETKKKTLQVKAAVNPDMTYEELLHVLIRAHERRPELIEKLG